MKLMKRNKHLASIIQYFIKHKRYCYRSDNWVVVYNHEKKRDYRFCIEDLGNFYGLELERYVEDIDLRWAGYSMIKINKKQYLFLLEFINSVQKK